MIPELRTLFTPRGGLAWAVLLASVLLVLMARNGMQEQNARNAEQQFELLSAEVVEAITLRLHDHEQILLGGAGLFDASSKVSRAEWHTYVERLRLADNYPGILGMGYSEVIPPARLAAHIGAVRAEGFPEYTVRPPGERALYTAILYLEPFVGRNLAAFGYDMYSQETRRAAMQAAVDNDTTSISGKVKLVQETHGKEQAGFLMYVPVYHVELPRTTAEERWRALMGFIYSPYRVEDLMRGILGERSPVIDFALYDGDTAGPDALMYTSAEGHAASTPGQSRHTSVRHIRAYDHTWTVNLVSRPDFEAGFASPMDWLLPTLGIGISLALFGLAWSLLSHREQALALAEDMSAKRAESEERFHQLFLHLGQGVVIHQADGRIADANPAAEHILGLQQAQMRGSAPMDPLWRCVREDGNDFPGQEHPAMLALHSGKPVTGVVMGVFRPSSGDWRWIRVDAYPRHAAPNGEVQQVYAVFSDFTQIRAADLEVREAQKFLSDVLAAASEVSIIATDRSGLITVFNRGAERMLGYSADEMVGKQSPAILHLPAEVAARSEELSRQCGHVVSGFRVFVEIPDQTGAEQREWTYVRKDGSHVAVSLMVTAMRGDDGVPLGYLGIAEDITERKQAETALQEQVQHTQAVLDNMVDGIITIDTEGTIHSFNPAAARIFCYGAQEVLGQNVRMLMPNPHRDAHDSYLRSYQATGVARIIGIGREVEGQRKDGSVFPMDLAISEITRQGKAMYVGMVRDITERKRTERMKSEFVSTVSHELRTPLTAISGALGLLAGNALGALPPQARQMIDIAYKNSQRLTLLINDLLDMEKITAGKLHFDMQPQPLMALVEQALEANRAYGAERHVTLALRGDAFDTRVRVDSQRLMQVLSNLLSNAVKYSPPEGVVDVTVAAHGGWVRVTVTDHGAGIPAEFRTRIFQKFAQADSSDTRQKGGTGLGLAITRELVERMGGRIDFESVEGAGANFYFELPVWNGHGTATGSATGTPANSEEPHVLVVEDEPDIAQLLALLLRRAGYAVDIAANGAEALLALERSHYAAMTLDLMLPDISGLEVIRRVRMHPDTAGLPIVVVSAKMQEGRLALNGDFSNIDWLAKPIDEVALLGLVERFAATAGVMQPRVLHVEDDPDLHHVVRAMIGGRFAVELASTLQEARARVALERFDVVVLDLTLPDGSGWDLLPEVRARQPEARVVILSGTDMTPDQTHKVEAVLLKTQFSPQQLLDALSTRIHPARRKGDPRQ